MMQLEHLQNIDVDDVLGVVGLARRHRMSGAEAFLMGVGFGLAGGAVIALMVTPYSGSETRQKLARASGDLGRTVAQKVNEIKTNLQTGVNHTLEAHESRAQGTQGTQGTQARSV